MNDYVYKYEHTNGEIITKPRIVVETNTTPEEYFDSPFVNRWWKEEIRPADYCEIGMSSCRCGWQGDYPVSGCPRCNHSFVE